MITITQITSDNENKLMGEIDNFSYCITYNKNIHDTLVRLTKQIDLCESFEDWNAIILEAKKLVNNIPYKIQNSKYFVKINDNFFLTDGKKYYNILDSKNIIKNTLNYYIDKGLNIDKFAVFIARKGNPLILKLNNIYHKLNKNGNIRMNVSGNYYKSNNYYKVNNNKIIIDELVYPRYFINNSLIESNTNYSLKSLGAKFSDIIESDNGDGLPMLIKPDLTCFIGDLEEGGLTIDPDDSTIWDDYITLFINKYGKKR